MSFRWLSTFRSATTRESLRSSSPCSLWRSQRRVTTCQLSSAWSTVCLTVSERDQAWETLLLRQESLRKRRSGESKRWSTIFSVRSPSKTGSLRLSKNQSLCRRMSCKLLRWFLRIRSFAAMRTLWESYRSLEQPICCKENGSLSMRTTKKLSRTLIMFTTLWCRLQDSSTSKLKSHTG